MTRITSSSLEQTSQIARDWLRLISEKEIAVRRETPESEIESGASVEATITGLSGDLGAGKTAFVKCVAKELGIKEVVTSPTFVIMKIYQIDLVGMKNIPVIDFPWKQLIHIDAYRLERGEELEALKFSELVKDRDNLILIEWPENVMKILNKSARYSQVNFTVGTNDTERVIEYGGSESN